MPTHGPPPESRSSVDRLIPAYFTAPSAPARTRAQRPLARWSQRMAKKRFIPLPETCPI